MIGVRNVAVELGETAVLDGVSATVPEGKLVGLVGPNGAGKTTLLRTIHGVLDPDRGEVRIGGDPVRALSSAEISRRIAVVPQDTTLSFDFPVENVVAMGRHPYRSRLSGPDADDRERVAAAMERTDVTEFAERPITAVSGGERKRVLLARALAQDAPILLLDEPTASLDVNHQVRTLELVRDLVDEDGKTVVAAIHDLDLAARYCDELRLLTDGEIRAAGEPGAVLSEANVEAAFDTKAAVATHPTTGSPAVTALPDRRDGSAGRVHVIGGAGSTADLLYRLAAAGYEVSVGALPEGDADLETARALGLDAVTVPPFASVDAETRRAVEDRVRAADATVLGDVTVTPGNLANLRALRAADTPVLVEDRSFEQRNEAGGDAAAVYRDVRERGRVVESERLLSAVESAVADDPPAKRAVSDGGSE